MDRLPDDPSPDDPTPDRPTPGPEPAAADDHRPPGIPSADIPPPDIPPPPGPLPVPPSPYGPGPAADGAPLPPYGPPPGQPPGLFASPAAPAAKDDRPGVGAGVATGCGLQVLAVVLVILTAGFVWGIYGFVWPFVVVTVAAALLMISKRWRRFATGALIVCAAMWIVVIGPCIALLSPAMWGA